MTLATHAIVGAALARFIPNPVLAFSGGFISHFFLDALPHWDYKLASARRDPHEPLNDTMVGGPDFYRDLLKIGFDVLLGLAVIRWWWPTLPTVAFLTLLAGAFGGMFPDFLQFVYFKWRREPLTTLQRFHTNYVHTRHRLNRVFIGILSQAALAAIALLLAGR